MLAWPISALTACSTLKDLPARILPDPTQQARKDSNSIYTTILSEIYPGQELYVVDRSSKSFRGDLSFELENDVLTGLQFDTARNFEGIAEISRDLGWIFTPGEPGLILIDPAIYYVEHSEANSGDCSWMMTKCFDTRKFNADYPGMEGFIQFSNIGFNNDKTQAIAAAQLQNEKESGTIFIVLLSKEQGEWEIQSKFELFWIV